MRRSPVLLPALAVVAYAVAPATARGPIPQVIDTRGDANVVNSQGEPAPVPNNTPLPVGSQAYADVTSVLWQTTKTGGKVTGFTVTLTLIGPPAPPSGTTVVYRLLGTTPACPYFGIAYYSNHLKTASTPQSALRDNCNGKPTARLTKIALPKVKGTTLTWTVPLSAIPKDTKVKAGTTLKRLYFTVTEIEDLQGQQVPHEVPVFGDATGFGYGVVDDSTPGIASYRIG